MPAAAPSFRHFKRPTIPLRFSWIAGVLPKGEWYRLHEDFRIPKSPAMAGLWTRSKGTISRDVSSGRSQTGCGSQPERCAAPYRTTAVRPPTSINLAAGVGAQTGGVRSDLEEPFHRGQERG